MATDPVHMTQRRPDQMLDHVDALSSPDTTTPSCVGVNHIGPLGSVHGSLSVMDTFDIQM